ncbi:uncharacterized protein FIBRA_09279 [Fibroporia radiculosa]|uniref:Uncharacterized protein n=1 Tax=Fibroporia radiculosa TaxID=599839 RepID=J7RVN8_9APHY|nr:uncharacterized protein FIBRA_09279 [Fibroporia radiculosa]CCM06965.1 predicted protein [Fibroporia radiculosa]
MSLEHIKMHLKVGVSFLWKKSFFHLKSSFEPFRTLNPSTPTSDNAS